VFLKGIGIEVNTRIIESREDEVKRLCRMKTEVEVEGVLP